MKVFNKSTLVGLGELISLSIFTLFFLGISSCSHEGDPNAVETISYKEQIAPIISGNCSMTGCHDGGEEFSLKSYSDVMNNVSAGDSKGSELYTSVSSSFGFIRMPPSPADPLTKQQRTLIDLWIGQGAKNN